MINSRRKNKMGKNRWHDKPDQNAASIISFLKLHGIEIIRTDKPLDILIWNGPGKCGFAEIKTDARDAHILRTQIEFIVNHSIPSMIVKNEGEALIFAETMQGFSDAEKAKMDGWLIRNPKIKSLHPAAFERVLSWK